MGDTLAVPAVSDAETEHMDAAARQTKREAAIQLLRSWREGDEEERKRQKETWEYLKRVLDEDRLSYRKFFPPESE